MVGAVVSRYYITSIRQIGGGVRRLYARTQAEANADRDGSCEPVTVTGWYRQPTVSGRDAWRYCSWHAGRLHTEVPTYDRAAHEELEEAGRAHYDAQRAYQDHHPAAVRS